MSIETYEEKYKLIQKLIHSHASLNTSFWFNFVKDELQFALTYKQMVKTITNEKAFRHEWKFGKFIQKIKNEMILFEDFSYHSLFLPLNKEKKSNQWALAF